MFRCVRREEVCIVLKQCVWEREVMTECVCVCVCEHLEVIIGCLWTNFKNSSERKKLNNL